ncbi:macro domain-containing protein [Streptomyces sp. NPDC021020]|uniref:type II toxin-antitoxin system antitoxin DNA ADP-ribosyl glycohydrolase DarG n=1 Tax=Streptomyces sp. NPDC021020 TaxID=3365109 RepID=UPI0037AF6455
MITRGTGNLLLAEVDALVNTVNTVGIMGKGIALQFKRAFPENFDAYKASCERGEVRVGAMHVHEMQQAGGPRFIINFPTKRHWRSSSKLADIAAGLIALRDEIIQRDITSIAVPPLGCGNGGLSWSDVEPLIEQTLGSVPGAEVRVWAPEGAPTPSAMLTRTERPAMNRERATFIATLDRYINRSVSRGLAFQSRVSLLEAHKVAYFLQKLGLPLGLTFAKGPYGPYSQRLDTAVSGMEGHFITGFGDGTSGAQAVLELDKEAVLEAQDYLTPSPTYAKVGLIFDELTAGFEDPFGMELLSTVLFAAQELVEPPVSIDAVADYIQSWSPRKQRLFTRQHIETAWERLVESGMMDVSGIDCRQNSSHSALK